MKERELRVAPIYGYGNKKLASVAVYKLLARTAAVSSTTASLFLIMNDLHLAVLTGTSSRGNKKYRR